MRVRSNAEALVLLKADPKYLDLTDRYEKQTTRVERAQRDLAQAISDHHFSVIARAEVERERRQYMDACIRGEVL